MCTSRIHLVYIEAEIIIVFYEIEKIKYIESKEN